MTSPHRSKGRLLGICAIITIAIVLLAVILSGALTPTSSGETGITFRPAWSDGNRSTSVAGGTNWTLSLAAGYDFPSSFSIGLSNITESCTPTPVANSPVPTSLSIPAFSGSLKSGDSPFWLLAYEQNSTGDILLVSVSNGVAQPIGVVAASCLGTGLPDASIPGAVLDSSTAATIAEANGGSAYVAAHPGAFLEMGVIGGFSGLHGGPFWSFDYSPCNPFGGQNPSGNASELVIEMSALSGTVYGALNVTATCLGTPMSTPLGTAFAFGSAQSEKPSTSTAGECTAYDYCYDIPIVSATQGLTANDVELELTSDTGSFISTMGFYIDGSTYVEGYLTAPLGENPATMWFSGAGTITASTDLTVGDTIWIDVSSTINPVGQGDQLTAVGLGSFSGQVQITLP
ncbi:MAG: hypothetical protein WAN87_05660 [Thermoplasmata archaeon]